MMIMNMVMMMIMKVMMIMMMSSVKPLICKQNLTYTLLMRYSEGYNTSLL